MIFLKKWHGRLEAFMSGDARPVFAGATPFVSATRSIAWLLLGALALAIIVAFLVVHAPTAHASMGLMGVVGSTKLKDLNAKLAAKQDELHAIFEAAGAENDFSKENVLKLAGAKTSAEVVEKVKAANAELIDLAKQAEELRMVEETRERIEKARRDRATPVDENPVMKQDDPSRSGRSFGELLVTHEQFETFRKAKQSNSRAKFEGEIKGFGLKELKSNFATSAGWAPQSTRVPGLVVPIATRPIQLLDIIPTVPTSQAAVKYMEETTLTNNAAERSEAGIYVESALALTERSVTVRSIGTSIPVTDEQLEDVAEASAYLNQRLPFLVYQRLDGQVLLGDNSAPNIQGLKGLSGINTQAKSTDSVPDAFYKAMVACRITGRAIPNAHIIHPTDWQGVKLLKTADGIYIYGSPSNEGPDRLWGLPVAQCDADSAGTGYTGDFLNFAAMYERRGMQVLIGYDSDDFTKGLQTARAGVRVAMVWYRPAAFTKVTGL